MLAAGRAFGRGTHFVKSIGSGFAQEDGQRKDGVIALAGKRRVSRSNVFDYHKRELKGIGVKNASACACARGLAPIANPTAYFKAWREAKWGGDFDPVRVAVDEAVKAFSSGKSAEAQANDRRIWLKITNRIGFEAFLDAFDQKRAELEDHRQAHRGGGVMATRWLKFRNHS